MDNISLIYYRHNFFSKVKSINRGTILFNELTIVTKGTLIYEVNGEKQVVPEGCSIFIPYGSERTRRGDTIADFISFNFLDKGDYSSFSTITKGFVDNETIYLLRLSDLFEKNKVGNLKGKLTGILYSLLVKMFDYYNQPKYSKLTLSIINFLENHIFEQIKLKDIEKQVYLTSNYFEKIFKKETGYSIIKYFNYLKLEKAKALITEQEKSLEEISIQIGFNDYNYFSRLFKKYYCISPNEYKNQFIVKS